MQDLPSSFHDGFTKMYDSATPWDIGRPKAPFIAVADRIADPFSMRGAGPGIRPFISRTWAERSPVSISWRRRSAGHKRRRRNAACPRNSW